MISRLSRGSALKLLLQKRTGLSPAQSLLTPCSVVATTAAQLSTAAHADVVYSLHKMERSNHHHLKQRRPSILASSSSSSAVLAPRQVPKMVLPFDDQNHETTASDSGDRSSASHDLHEPDGLLLSSVADQHEPPRTSVLLELTDGVGVLHDVLRYFWKHNVNICRIESRPVYHRNSRRPLNTGGENGQQSQKPSFDFFVDFEGSSNDDNVRQLLDDLHQLTDQLLLLDAKSVHWFPRHISELDRIAHRTLDAGIDLQAVDHPGFHDPVYRARRGTLAQQSAHHVWDQPIGHVEYTDNETMVWTTVWDRMEPLWERYACKEYRSALHEMQTNCDYRRDNIPQQQSISEYLQHRTGFMMRPVPGLLSSRDFLNGLAFRVFFCTQYMRHHSQPLYTPEPDLCHELLGHAPMLSDPDFADFSQEIGLASLGASNEDVTKLARCYWHSVEFGLCQENGKNKAYGAGLLSSFGELEYACRENQQSATSSPTFLPWVPEVAAQQDFPITSYQPIYFVSASLQDTKLKMRRYCENLSRPFFAMHNAQTHTVHIDRPVKRSKGIPE